MAVRQGKKSREAAGAREPGPLSPPLVTRALDAFARLAQERVPWQVRATTVFLRDDGDDLRIDLVVQYATRPWFVAITCAPGAAEWSFYRHPVPGRDGYQDVCFDQYLIGRNAVEQRPVRFDSTQRLFRLATVEAPSRPNGEHVQPDPHGVGVTTIRAQDALGRMWLPGRLAGDSNASATRNATVVSVILTDRRLSHVSSVQSEPATGGTQTAASQSTPLDWLWLEFSSPRPALAEAVDDGRLPFAFDSLFTRHVAIAGVTGLQPLLRSEGWPSGMF